MNIISKVYERVKKLQNENKQVNKSSMQTEGKKNKSTIDNLIIMNAINKKQKQDHKNTYILHADAKKMLWQTLVERQFDRDGKNRI